MSGSHTYMKVYIHKLTDLCFINRKFSYQPSFSSPKQPSARPSVFNHGYLDFICSGVSRTFLAPSSLRKQEKVIKIITGY